MLQPVHVAVAEAPMEVEAAAGDEVIAKLLAKQDELSKVCCGSLFLRFFVVIFYVRLSKVLMNPRVESQEACESRRASHI